MLGNFSYSVLIGFIPALVWMWFWLKEDKEHPEPKRTIFMVFLGGMMAVALAIPLELFAEKLYPDIKTKLMLWATIEEILKFGAVWLFAIYKKNVIDEPIDFMIYMITAGLGFAALENTLFVLKPMLTDNIMQGLVLGNMRFLGATMVHISASATVGFLLGSVFYWHRTFKFFSIIIGLALASVLHAIFNLFIIKSSGIDRILVFVSVWISATLLLILFEEIKKVRPKQISI